MKIIAALGLMAALVAAQVNDDADQQDVNNSWLDNANKLKMAIENGGPFKKYIDKVGDVNFSYSDGEYPLSLAIRAGRKDIVEFLWSKNANLNFINKNKDGDRYGYSPMHYAALYDQKEIALFLNSKKAICDAKDKNGNTPLHIAASYGHEIIETLIYFVTQKTIKNNDGWDALHLLVKYGYEGDRIRTMAWHYRDVINSPGARGNTALHLAALHCNRNIAETLIDETASIKAKNDDNQTPKDLLLGCENKQEMLNVLDCTCSRSKRSVESNTNCSCGKSHRIAPSISTIPPALIYPSNSIEACLPSFELQIICYAIISLFFIVMCIAFYGLGKYSRSIKPIPYGRFCG